MEKHAMKDLLKCAGVSIVMMIVFAHALFPKAAAPPTMETFSCPNGPMPYGWKVISDEDGDGNYDYYTQRNCDGTIEYGCLQDPCGADDQLISIVPVNVSATTFFYTTCGSGDYEWTVVEFDGSNVEAGRTMRDCQNNLVTTFTIIPSGIQIPEVNLSESQKQEGKMRATIVGKSLEQGGMIIDSKKYTGFKINQFTGYGEVLIDAWLPEGYEPVYGLNGQGLPPKLVSWPGSGGGGERPMGWFILEDLNQDGEYDYWVAAWCNGHLEAGLGTLVLNFGDGEDVEPSDLENLPSSPVATLDFSSNMQMLTPVLESTACTSGYQWSVKYVDANSVEFCRVSSDCSQNYSVTCPTTQTSIETDDMNKHEDEVSPDREIELSINK